MESKDSYSPQEVAEMIRNRYEYFTEQRKGCASLDDYPDRGRLIKLTKQMPKNVMSILEKILNK